MRMSRRMFSYLCASAIASRVVGQSGMASRGLTQRPRAAPSGRPFAAHFTDVSARAGLVAPVIYGEVNRKEYILEADGCGCAFIDYDNDGWMDIFLLTGTRLTGPPLGTTNRLYKNNRDFRGRSCCRSQVDAPAGLVKHAIFGEDFVDGRAPTRRIVFTEDVVKIAG